MKVNAYINKPKCKPKHENENMYFEPIASVMKAEINHAKPPTKSNKHDWRGPLKSSPTPPNIFERELNRIPIQESNWRNIDIVEITTIFMFSFRKIDSLVIFQLDI